MSSNAAAAAAPPLLTPAATHRLSVRRLGLGVRDAVQGVEKHVEDEQVCTSAIEAGTQALELVKSLADKGVDISPIKVVADVLNVLHHVPWLGPVVGTLYSIFGLYQVLRSLCSSGTIGPRLITSSE